MLQAFTECEIYDAIDIDIVIRREIIDFMPIPYLAAEQKPFKSSSIAISQTIFQLFLESRFSVVPCLCSFERDSKFLDKY
jgi:hypothetical protein